MLPYTTKLSSKTIWEKKSTTIGTCECHEKDVGDSFFFTEDDDYIPLYNIFDLLLWGDRTFGYHPVWSTRESEQHTRGINIGTFMAHPQRIEENKK